MVFLNLAYYSRTDCKNKDLLIIRYTFVIYKFAKKTTRYMVILPKTVQYEGVQKF